MLIDADLRYLLTSTRTLFSFSCWLWSKNVAKLQQHLLNCCTSPNRPSWWAFAV